MRFKADSMFRFSNRLHRCQLSLIWHLAKVARHFFGAYSVDSCQFNEYFLANLHVEILGKFTAICQLSRAFLAWQTHRASRVCSAENNSVPTPYLPKLSTFAEGTFVAPSQKSVAINRRPIWLGNYASSGFLRVYPSPICIWTFDFVYKNPSTHQSPYVKNRYRADA